MRWKNVYSTVQYITTNLFITPRTKFYQNWATFIKEIIYIGLLFIGTLCIGLVVYFAPTCKINKRIQLITQVGPDVIMSGR